MKHRFLRILFPLILAILFGGCGGGYHYDVKPTPLQKGISKYVLGDFKFSLTEDHRNKANLTYKNEQELKKDFVAAINKNLAQIGLLGVEGKDYRIDITMNYLRRFNYGGNALNKPYFDYSVEIFDNTGTRLASYAISTSTTKYSYFKDLAVNLQIGTYQRDAEDEPEDIELIAKTLVGEISEIGK